MPSENALAFLSQLDSGKALIPSVILIAGPQAFLKEYVLDACRAQLRGPGRESQSFQIGAGGDFGAVLEAIAAPGLFAPATIVACRILRTRQGATSGGEIRARDHLQQALRKPVDPGRGALCAPARTENQLRHCGYPG